MPSSVIASKGRFLNYRIKGKYAFERLGDERDKRLYTM